VVITQGAIDQDFTDDGTGTCTTNGASFVYSNTTCTVVVDFKPQVAGLRLGAVQLYSGSTLIATAPIYGVGSGPVAQFPSGGAQSSIGSSLSLPDAVAINDVGELFVSEASGLSGSIVEILPGGTVQTLVSGIPTPSFGVAVDGAGNVYYTDTAANTVKEIVAANGVVSPSSTVKAVGPSITAPEAIAVDGLGDLFVTNGLHVYEIPAVNGAPGSTAVTVGSGWTSPLGVAVDSSGNLFVTDAGDILNPNAGTVAEVTASGGTFGPSSTVTTVVQNLNSPGGLAVDAAGDLYVADTGDGEVKEFIATGGVVNTSSISQTLGTGFNGPDSIATDGWGNFYVSDGGLTSIVKLSLGAPPALSFHSTAVGSTSSDSPQSVLLQNAGNGTLSLSVADPSTASFALDNSTNCGSTLSASSNCTIGINFTPKATGSLTASVTVTDNTLGFSNSTQSISLSGTGTPGATVTTTMASAAAATFDPASQTVTLAASVMAGSNPATTGTVTFTVKNGATVIGSATTSGTLSSNGAASVSYVIPAGTQAGSYSIDAVYNPGATYAASSDSAQQLVISKATPVIATAPTASAITYGQTLASSTLSGGAAGYNSASVSGSFAFTAPSTAPNAGTPSESVTFTPADGNDYSTATTTTAVSVGQATAAVTVTGYTVAYSGSAHTATGTATGISSANLAADLNLSATTHTNAGVYSSDSWSFTDPNGNYAPQSGTVTDIIERATPTIAIASLPGSAYAGGSFTPTFTYTGDGTPSVTSQTPSVCTVNAAVVSFVAGGTCTLTPGATAGVNYTAVTGASQSFQVTEVEAVGSTSPTLTATVTITNPGTIGQINVLPSTDYTYVSGGTCATGTTYTANQTCTVNYTFKPSRPGQRMGAVSLTTGSDGSATVLGNAFIAAMGSGPLAVFPGTQTFVPLAASPTVNVPVGVAVDASGNVFVADTGNNSVEEIEAVNGVIPASPTVRTLLSDTPIAALAVDASGNVYAAESGNGGYPGKVDEVEAVNGVIPASPTVRALMSGLGQITSMAVDANGNLYAADPTTVEEMEAVNGIIPDTPAIRTLARVTANVNSEGMAVDASGNVYFSDGTAVMEIEAVNGVIPASPTIRTLASGLNEPYSLAVDASGNIYVSVAGNQQIDEIQAVNGVIPASPTIQPLSQFVLIAAGLAVDDSGHLFASGVTQGGPFVDEIDLTQAPPLSYASTKDGQTSSDSPQSVTVQNDGNQPLSFASIALSSGASDFALDKSGTCSASTPLAGSATCTVAANFSPTNSGSLTGVITLTDNSLNATAATQSVSLSGTGTSALTATTTWANTISTTYSPFTQAVTLSASVTAGGQPVTTGTVAFTLENVTTPIGGTISGTLNSQGETSVSYTLPAGLQAGGLYRIIAVYNPGTGYAASSDNTHLVNIGKVQTSFSLTAPTNTIAGSSMFFVANFTPSFVSSGTVTFYADKTPLGTASVVSGRAQILANLNAGSYSISAVYSGDNDYTSSTAVGGGFDVSDPVTFFPTQTTSTAQTVAPGGTATYDLKLGIPDTTFPAPVTLSTSGVPPGATATITPAVITAGSPNTDVLVAVHLSPSTARLETSPLPFRTGAPLCFGLLLLPFTRKLRRRARKLRALLLLAVFAASMAGMAGLSGCGGSTGYFTSPPKTYTITVTATCEGVSSSTQVLLTVE
jgi:sugar lactone lactonase YvrE